MALYDGPEFYDSPSSFYDAALPAPAKRKRMKVKLSLVGLSESDRVAKLQDVVTHMTGNANFPTPNPTLASVQTRITAASAAITAAIAAVTAARMANQEKRDALDAVDNDYRLLGLYVENAADGDEAKIASAGFELRAPAAPVGIPTAPGNVVATAGEFPGQLVLRWDPVTGSVIYEIQTTANPMSESSWVSRGTSTKTSGSVSGLTSGEHCWSRVRAIGSAGPGPFSDAAAKTVP